MCKCVIAFRSGKAVEKRKLVRESNQDGVSSQAVLFRSKVKTIF